jgi:hypothetical protein
VIAARKEGGISATMDIPAEPHGDAKSPGLEFEVPISRETWASARERSRALAVDSLSVAMAFGSRPSYGNSPVPNAVAVALPDSGQQFQTQASDELKVIEGDKSNA